MPADDLLSVPKAVPVLGVTARTLGRWVDLRMIPYTVDRQHRIRVIARSDLDAYVARSQLKPGEPGPATTGNKWVPKRSRAVQS